MSRPFPPLAPRMGLGGPDDRLNIDSARCVLIVFPWEQAVGLSAATIRAITADRDPQERVVVVSQRPAALTPTRGEPQACALEIVDTPCDALAGDVLILDDLCSGDKHGIAGQQPLISQAQRSRPSRLVALSRFKPASRLPVWKRTRIPGVVGGARVCKAFDAVVGLQYLGTRPDASGEPLSNPGLSDLAFSVFRADQPSDDPWSRVGPLIVRNGCLQLSDVFIELCRRYR